jgi:DNA topoisomerase-6 subunit B
MAVEDNGPGIVQQQIPKIFGKLLYGSKFHRLKQQRGQQGIGISAAGMYGVLTTGKPVRIISKIGARKPAHLFEISIDTQKNAPVVHKDVETEWDKDHGTRVEIGWSDLQERAPLGG